MRTTEKVNGYENCVIFVINSKSCSAPCFFPGFDAYRYLHLNLNRRIRVATIRPSLCVAFLLN